MSVFYISLILEILLIEKIASLRINIKRIVSIILMVISLLLIMISFLINNKIKIINPFLYYLIPIFVFIFYMDLKEYLIINEYNLLLLIFSIIYFLLNFLINNLLIFILFILVMIIIKLYERITSKDLIGDGDLKLFISLSLIFGIYSFNAIFIASIIGLITELIKRITKHNKTLIPFGPYLVIGYYLVMFIYL